MSCFSALGRERDAGISLAARCHTFLYRRPTRRSSLLHVYMMVFDYVSSFLGFPCETVTGLRHPTWCAASSKLVSRFFQGSSQIFFFSNCVFFFRQHYLARGLPNGFHGFAREFTNCVSQLCFSFISNSSANLYLATSSHQLEFYLWFVFFAWAADVQFYTFLTALCGSIFESTHNGAHH